VAEHLNWLPRGLILGQDHRLRIFERAAIDAAADDMTLRVHLRPL